MRQFQPLNEKAQSRGFQDYEHYLKSSIHWHAFSQRYIGKRCWCCYESRPYNLLLHHLIYERLGRELPRDVVTLCRWCHEKVHQMIHDREAQLHDAHVKLCAAFLNSEQMNLTFDRPDSCNQTEQNLPDDQEIVA